MKKKIAIQIILGLGIGLLMQHGVFAVEGIDLGNMSSGLSILTNQYVKIFAGVVFGCGILGAIGGKMTGQNVILIPCVIAIILSFVALAVPAGMNFTMGKATTTTISFQ